MNISCDEVQALIDGFADGELDLIRGVELDLHLKDCTACAALYESRARMSSAIRCGLLRPVTPESLRQRVSTAVQAIDIEERAGEASRLQMRWLAIAAVVVGLVFSSVLWLRRMTGPVLAEVVDSHIRSLMVNHLVDVASSDQHTVRPWFVGRLDFSPPVGDFAAEGFSLVGGRLDCINHQAVAALVYQRNQHVINVLIWPVNRRDTGVQKAFRQRYVILQTNRSGLDYWIVSDLNADELAKLVTLLALPQSK